MSRAASRSRPKASTPDLASMLTFHITSASFTSTGRLIAPANDYRLQLSAQPGVLIGPKSTKSDYRKLQSNVARWRSPFGGQFSIRPSSPDKRITISLVQRNSSPTGEVAGSSVLDVSSLATAATGLLLLSPSDQVIGHIVLSITSTGPSTSTVAMDAVRDADALSTPDVAEPIQTLAQAAATAPVVVAAAANPDAAKQLLDRIDTILKWGNTIPKIHSYGGLAWGVVSVMCEIVSAQNPLDDRIQGLLVAMNESCLFADDTGELKDRLERFHGIICQILKQVIECSYFVRDYCHDASLATLRMNNLGYTVDARINGYQADLVALQTALRSGSPHQAPTIWSRPHVLDIVADHRDLTFLEDLKYAPEAHPNLSAGCLPGTRTEIIDAMFYWGLGAHAPPSAAENPMMLPYRPSSRVLWVCGAMGTGKTSIIRSSAARMDDMGYRRVYYGFDKNQPNASITRLFSTIARDLADLDPMGKSRLVESLKEKTEIRTTGDCELQFKHFIVDTAVGATSFGETLIFIDAFDESGNFDERRQLLQILTQRASELPAGLRIVITSRYEPDVHEALKSRPDGVDIMRMQDVAEELTFRDIGKYVESSLQGVEELKGDGHRADLASLVSKAGTSFQWAATACRFIKSEKLGGVDPGEQLQIVLKSSQKLDALYATIITQYFSASDVHSLARFKSVLGRILCAREPLPLTALTHLGGDNLTAQRRIVKFLGSLLSGTHDDNTPIVTLHASFREFLHNSSRSGAFFVDEKESHELMALSCFQVMETELDFNICRIPTSFLPNIEISNIERLVHDHISLALSYASRNWPFHVSEMSNIATVNRSLVCLFQENFFKWLEVMSLSQTDSHGVLTAFTNVEMSVGIAKMKNDALRFISMFGQVIAESAAHIYLSAMAFIPTCSELYDSQCAHRLGSLQLLRGRLDHWPSLHAILKGHTKAVMSITFSPDGLQLASASADTTVQIWDAKTGASVGPPLKGHTKAVTSIAFSPDGLQLASASADTTVRIWDTKTGASVGPPLEGHTNWVNSIAFSPDGLQLASASDDTTVQIWDAKKGASVGPPLKGHTNWVTSIAFSPDGLQLASASRDTTVQIWDAKTGASVGPPLKGHTDRVTSIAFSPDGLQLASASWDTTVRIWDAKTGASVGPPLEWHTDWVTSIAFSPDGLQLASASLDSTVQIWDAKTGASVGPPLKGHTNPVTSITFSPDGLQLASASLDSTVRIWDAKTGASVGPPLEGHTNWVTSIVFSPDGLQLASASADTTVRIWDAKTGASVGPPLKGHTNWVTSIAFSPDGLQLASASRDTTVQIWDAKTGASVGPPLKGHTDRVTSIAFSLDGLQLASASWDTTVQIWDAKTGASVGPLLKGHTDRVTSIAFSPDGLQLASASLDSTVQIWDAKKGVSVGPPLKGHTDRVTSIAFSPDGLQLASASADATVQIWDAKTGASVGPPLKGHTNWVSSIAFSPDGLRLASASDDTTVRIWDAKTGASVGPPLEGHTDWVTSIAFSPDGLQLASASHDATVRIWDQPDAGASLQKYPEPVPLFNPALDHVKIPTSSDQRVLRMSQLGYEHQLQYPRHLFPQHVQPFQVQNGWIVGPNGELILWVPAAYRASLRNPYYVLCGGGNTTELDFQCVKYGEGWMQCRDPIIDSGA